MALGSIAETLTTYVTIPSCLQLACWSSVTLLIPQEHWLIFKLWVCPLHKAEQVKVLVSAIAQYEHGMNDQA